jgi:hypothetical protein
MWGIFVYGLVQRILLAVYGLVNVRCPVWSRFYNTLWMLYNIYNQMIVILPTRACLCVFVGLFYGSQTVAWATSWSFSYELVRTLFARLHIIGPILSKIGGSIPLLGLHAFFMRAHVCILCKHYVHVWLHAYARSHNIERILSKIGRDIPWVTGTCMAYLILARGRCAGACTHIACMCTARACVHSHIFWHIVQKLVYICSSAWATYFFRVHTM